MNQLNSLIIEGNIVRDAVLSEPVKDFKVCKFSIAVNRWHKNAAGEGESEVSYFDVETFGKMADFCAKQGGKGRGIRVVGRLKQDRWTDNTDKQKSRVYVVAEHVEFKPKLNLDSDSKSAEELKAEEEAAKAEQVASEVLEKEEVTVF